MSEYEILDDKRYPVNGAYRIGLACIYNIPFMYVEAYYKKTERPDKWCLFVYDYSDGFDKPAKKLLKQIVDTPKEYSGEQFELPEEFRAVPSL